MTWSLQLTDGDFALNGAQLATVTDEAKLLQDLRCALLERMGTDDMHPDYGSLIDGGVTPDGTVVQSSIGVADANQAATVLQSDIQRIAKAYMNQQLNRAKADQTTYNRVSLSPAEVLLNVSNVQITQIQDVLQVLVTLQTAAGESISVALPLTGTD